LSRDLLPYTKHVRRALLFLLVPFLFAQDSAFQPVGSQFPSPTEGEEAHQAWLKDLKAWRAERLTRMGYRDDQYRRPELLWSQRNFIQPQMMVEDRYFYDPATRQYTVDRYLDDLDKRYGGIDSVLIWPVYPNIGIDNRNQWDLHRDLPGGIPALRQMVDDFHRRHVRVFFPAMPWDNGTHDPGTSFAQATAQLMAEIGADGVNGDTFSGLPQSYRTASDATGHPVVFEPEGAPSSDEGLMWNNQSWGYWKYDFVPTASKLKWLEPRHLVQICDRWARDKTDNLQFAFFNGLGYESWENIWGIWNQITPRDAEALRRVARVEREFAELLVSPDWEPHVPALQYGGFATRFPRDGAQLWTVVNRNEFTVSGAQLVVDDVPGRVFYDVWHGEPLKPERTNGKVRLVFSMEPHGFGGVLAVDQGKTMPGLPKLLSEMRELSKVPLMSLSHEWKVLPQQFVPIAKAHAASLPTGMVRVPAAAFDFKVSGVEIEGSNWEGVDFQYPGEPSARRNHRLQIQIPSFAIDRYPVTNADFFQFMQTTKYHPADDHNFLKDWRDGHPQTGWEKKPVTWVSLEDARAYAKWAGKRLPHEWEWQYAAQGTDGRKYPWGNEWNAVAMPAPVKGRELTAPADVDAHPEGKSPFGVMDMSGNVWQWTDEVTDEHTRAAALRGGSYYQPQNSKWYFPNVSALTTHGKYLLMAPSKDRAGTLGFRCAVDL
jgi:iron(II)-dependent oxidoreductase